MAEKQKGGSSLKAYNGTSQTQKVFTGNVKEFNLNLDPARWSWKMTSAERWGRHCEKVTVATGWRAIWLEKRGSQEDRWRSNSSNSSDWWQLGCTRWSEAWRAVNGFKTERNSKNTYVRDICWQVRQYANFLSLPSRMWLTFSHPLEDYRAKPEVSQGRGCWASEYHVSSCLDLQPVSQLSPLLTSKLVQTHFCFDLCCKHLLHCLKF